MNVRLVGFFLVLGVAVGSWFLTCAAWRAERVMNEVRPLEPRAFERFTLVTVGTGGAYENPSRGGPALLVGLGEALALVDAGRAVAEGLRAAEIPVSQPARVYLTSLLPENSVGLDDLWLTGWRQGRQGPLQVVGPEGTAALVAGLRRAHAAGQRGLGEALGLPPAGGELVAVEIGDGWSEHGGGVSVRASALPGGPLPALAYRFEAGGRSLAVAPVGWSPEALLAAVRGADVLVHEAAYIPPPDEAEAIGLAVDPERLRREGTLHTSIAGAGELARKAGVETLVLVRLRPPPVYDLQITGLVNDHFAGRIVVADDGDEITP